MSMQDVTKPFALAAVNEFGAVLSHLPGGDWLKPIRKAALARLEAQGFPSRRDERWKYTDVTPLLQASFTPASLAAAPEVFLQGVQRFELDCHSIVFLNGQYQRNLSSVPDDGNVSVRPLAAVLDNDPGALRELLAERTEQAEGFTALNAAYLHDGAVIDIRRGVTLDKPLHLVFLSTPHKPSSVAACPRIVYAGGENSSACLLESHLGFDGASNFLNLVTDVTLAQGARLRHLRVIEAGVEEFHIANIAARVGRDARYDSHQLCLGGKLVRNDIKVELLADNAEAELNGFVLAGGTQHVDNHLEVRHLAPHTNSRQYYRSVLDGRSRAVFNGKVYVAPKAQKIDAEQASNNLLLSKLAEIDTKPELEIYADDVKCSHGATVGQLDEAMLFYLRSRGIDAETARGLLIYAFADDVIRRVGIPEIRTHVEDAVLGRLPDSDRLREFV